jgi:hypothetical protein
MRYYSNRGLGALLILGNDGAIHFLGLFGGDLAGQNLQAVGSPEADGTVTLGRLTYPACSASDWPKPAVGSQALGSAVLTIAEDTVRIEYTLSRAAMQDGLQFSPPPPPTFSGVIELARQV